MGEDQVFLARTKFWRKNFQFSNNIFYDYYVNQKGQLTTNFEAINDLTHSLNLMIDIEKDSRSDFLRIACVRMAVTILKKSSMRNKMKAVLILLKFLGKFGLVQTIQILFSIATSRG
jgi:hypothetical protein